MITDIINIAKLLSGDKRSIAKAISLIENDYPHKYELLKSTYKYTGNAYRIGITGPPGAGKSTITDCLIKLLVKNNYKVGVIAVDPTSPFTGGALLGDRVRMTESSILENVFVRSMATRGSLGGLSKNVDDACNILDASGKDYILIETVGVGQSELDIAKTSDTTVVVLVPESGDSIQAMKAGLMEIADIFVLNKSDRQGSDELVSSIKNIIHLKKPADDNWTVNVLKTIASSNKGIMEMFEEILKHKKHLEESGFLVTKRKNHIADKIKENINHVLQKNFWDEKKNRLMNTKLDEIYNKIYDPYTFADELINLPSE